MNLTLYGHAGHWIAVDLGITFGNDEFPAFDVMMADPAFIGDQRERLAAIVLTHGHEDHIGAVPYLWRRLQCPIYATPFTAALVRAKLARAGIDDAPLIEVTAGQRVHAGPFTIEYLHMTHSIPEPHMLLIDTPAGAVLHTGDWKLDDDPVVGRAYDRARLEALRQQRLLALVCDSTNAVVAGRTASEGSLFEPLCDVVDAAEGRVIVTSFASNVARLVTLARVAAAVGRQFGVVGQAMERMVMLARATGYWPDDLNVPIDPRHLGYLPRREVLAACTGSQGEPRSALVRMANDAHRDIQLDWGDTVVFSSRLIPGNERPVEQLEERLRALGVEVITDRDAHVHVSGHPARDDLRQLFAWIQPTTLIPVHGTPRHLAANAALGRECHVREVPEVRNGDLYRLAADGPVWLSRVASGRLAVTADGLLEPLPADLLAAMRDHAC